MGKEIILLAESKKYNNLCIAGIDTSTGDWIRIVSQDSGVSHAVKVEDAIYEDGSVPELLDIVEIECNGCQLNYYQIENYVYDPGYYWSKIGRATIRDVLKIHPLEHKDFIFHNTDKRVHKDYLLELNDEFKYSLMLIRPTRIKGHVRQWPNRKDVILQVAGVSLVFKSNIHQKYAVIDQRIVWYGSINLLSFGSAEESIMRLDSPNIANELVMSMDK